MLLYAKLLVHRPAGCSCGFQMMTAMSDHYYAALLIRLAVQAETDFRVATLHVHLHAIGEMIGLERANVQYHRKQALKELRNMMDEKGESL